MATRTVTWGEALLVAAVTSPGGLNKTVDRIRGVVGPQIGTRNSFAKLYKLAPSEHKATDAWRAWLLITAVGKDPADWGIYNDVVPAIFAEQLDALKERLVHPLGLEPRTHWVWDTPSVTIHPRGRAPRNTHPQGRK